MMTELKMQKVVTWQSPRGNKLDICPACEEQLRRDDAWPKDGTGAEYCQVSRGLHQGICEVCSDEELGIAAHTPNGREVRRQGDKYVVQPHNDNYWIECGSVAEALYKFANPHEDYAPAAATAIAQMIVDSWSSEWSIAETARVGVSEEDREEAGFDEAVVREIERICRERSR